MRIVAGDVDKDGMVKYLSEHFEAHPHGVGYVIVYKGTDSLASGDIFPKEDIKHILVAIESGYRVGLLTGTRFMRDSVNRIYTQNEARAVMGSIEPIRK